MATLDTGEVKRFIPEHIGKIRTIAQVAQHFGTSRSNLSMIWKRSGERISLGRFIETIRCRAALAVHHTNPTALCKEVAASAGYHSRAVALRSFRCTIGYAREAPFVFDSVLNEFCFDFICARETSLGQREYVA